MQFICGEPVSDECYCIPYAQVFRAGGGAAPGARFGIVTFSPDVPNVGRPPGRRCPEVTGADVGSRCLAGLHEPKQARLFIAHPEYHQDPMIRA